MNEIISPEIERKSNKRLGLINELTSYLMAITKSKILRHEKRTGLHHLSRQ